MSPFLAEERDGASQRPGGEGLVTRREVCRETEGAPGGRAGEWSRWATLGEERRMEPAGTLRIS